MPPWAERVEDELARMWAERILRDVRTNARIIEQWRQARDAELRWLRESMTADGIPEHIQALVIEQW